MRKLRHSRAQLFSSNCPQGEEREPSSSWFIFLTTTLWYLDAFCPSRTETWVGSRGKGAGKRKKKQAV
jgi:hypothetical protein